MQKKQLTRIVLVLAVILLISVLVLGMIYMRARQAAYAQLERIIAEQGMTRSLSDPRKSRTECYPPGAGQASCVAFVYSVSDDICSTITQSLGNKECTYSQKHFASE